jgi:hypothetical protein
MTLLPGAIVISFGSYANFAILTSTVDAGPAAVAKRAGIAKAAQKASASTAQTRSRWPALRLKA